jgi:hypothetical protein
MFLQCRQAFPAHALRSAFFAARDACSNVATSLLWPATMSRRQALSNACAPEFGYPVSHRLVFGVELSRST